MRQGSLRFLGRAPLFLSLAPNACGQNIKLYVNGDSLGKYTVPQRGMATVPVTMKGNRPVR